SVAVKAVVAELRDTVPRLRRLRTANVPTPRLTLVVADGMSTSSTLLGTRSGLQLEAVFQLPSAEVPTHTMVYSSGSIGSLRHSSRSTYTAVADPLLRPCTSMVHSANVWRSVMTSLEKSLVGSEGR